MSIQNIMNACFAICITLLIYQNTQLKDEIETVKGFSQLDVDKTFDRLDELDELKARVEITIEDIYKNLNQIGSTYNERQDAVNEAYEAQNELVKMLNENQKLLIDNVQRIEKYLSE